jgi:hypothetical protein
VDVMETIEIELSDSEFLQLAKRAHELDITLNQLVNMILLAHVENDKPI